ncbi:MAG: ABC transporter permease, partial [Pseudomonadota bacterium]|nr:ABC transporter permease [Pseudomonadota bacterium]
LANRVVWIGIACAVLAYAYARFSFAHETAGRGWRWLPARRTRVVSDPLDRPGSDGAPGSDLARAAPVALPHATQRFDVGARMRQVLAITMRSFRDIVFGRGMLVVVAVAVVVALAGSELMEHLGVPVVPVTGFIAQRFADAQDFFGFVAPLMCVVYAGELVWREREAGLGPIVDATPMHDWVPLLGKGLGLGLALAVWQGMLMAAGVFTQVWAGHLDVQPLLWLQMLFGLELPGHLLFAVVAITVHVLVNQKIAGNLAALGAYALMLFAPNFGLEHPMLVYASDPGWAYSDMRGFGTTLGPVLWFKVYWAGWALLFAVIARLLWVRGVEQGVKPRLAIARARFSAPVASAAAVAVAVIVVAGGYVFYNTNVRNDYTTSAQRNARSVDYERRYGRNADVPQPTLAATRLRIELYPAQGSATIDGHDVFVNRTSRPIDTLHVETSASVDTGPLRFDRPATLVKDDTAHRLRIVKLATPLQPGESLGMDFVLRFGGRGFSAQGVDDSIAARASHFEQDWLPVLGYQNNRELGDEGMRRKLGLPARPEIPQLSNVRARYDIRGHERVQLDTTIGTVDGQTAVAPGMLRRSWREGGRRYFHYVTEAPIDNGYGIYSANYAVHEARWQDVAIRVYHHPAHAANVPRMAQSVRASLERYTRIFGPYPARQLTVVEAPGYALSARSHATSVRFFEGLALLNPDADWRKVDFVFAVMAHEMAHQWWGNLLVPAPVAGAPFVAESLAWYSALGVIADAKGEAHLDRFLDVMREDYLDPRARDGVPLLEAVDWFTAYRLGPFSMVALREAVGEARVNLALRRFMDKHGQAQTPLPTSLDLYAELKAVTPITQHEFLADLFERNTFWKLRTNTVSAEPVGNAWRVTLEVSAEKVSVDKQGNETKRPLKEQIDIGVYGPDSDEAPSETLYLAKHRLRAGTQRITVTVPKRPASAGIDPRNVLIDTRREDNVIVVAVQP